MNPHDAIAIRVRKGAERYRVHHAEIRRVGARAESEGDDRRRQEAGAFEKGPNGVPYVESKGIHGTSPPGDRGSEFRRSGSAAVITIAFLSTDGDQ